jgi:hypothetical protein
MPVVEKGMMRFCYHLMSTTYGSRGVAEATSSVDIQLRHILALFLMRGSRCMTILLLPVSFAHARLSFLQMNKR